MSILKSELYKRLRSEPKEDGSFPPGYLHFPEGYSEEFFKQLTAESLRIRVVKGRKHYTWEKTRERNEALDLNIYNRAISILLGVDRLTDNEWNKLEENSHNAETFAPQKRRRRIINKGLRD